MIRAVVAYGQSISEDFDVLEPSGHGKLLRRSILRKGEPLRLAIPFDSKTKIEIFDITGRCVYKTDVVGRSVGIPTNHLKSGIYFVRVETSGRPQLGQKFVILE